MGLDKIWVFGEANGDAVASITLEMLAAPYVDKVAYDAGRPRLGSVEPAGVRRHVLVQF